MQDKIHQVINSVCDINKKQADKLFKTHTSNDNPSTSYTPGPLNERKRLSGDNHPDPDSPELKGDPPPFAEPSSICALLKIEKGNNIALSPSPSSRTTNHSDLLGIGELERRGEIEELDEEPLIQPLLQRHYTKDMGKKFGIEIAMSTAYRPQTDGQSERTNQEVVQALCTVVNGHQNDRVDWLPIVEFALNNRYHKGLKTTPFYANYGYHPQIGSLPQLQSPIESVEDFVKNLHNVQKNTEKSLIQAAEDMKRLYDKHHGATADWPPSLGS